MTTSLSPRTLGIDAAPSAPGPIPFSRLVRVEWAKATDTRADNANTKHSGGRLFSQTTRLSARTESSPRDRPSSSQKISVLCSPISGARLEIRQGEPL